MATTEQRLNKLERDFERLQNAIAKDEVDHDTIDKDFIKLMGRVCAVVCDTGLDNETVLSRAESILNEMTSFAYGESDLFDFLPSFAHDDQRGRPLVKDDSDKGFPAGFLIGVAPLLKKLLGNKPLPPGMKMPTRPERWNADKHRRSAYSTRCARFRDGDNASVPIPTNVNSLARNILEARCEVTSTDILNPVGNVFISSDSEFIAVVGAGGYKEREPLLHYFFSNPSTQDASGAFADEDTIDLPFRTIPYKGIVDSERKLLFLGTDNRIKSYLWNTNGNESTKFLPTHTFESGRFRGPMALLPGGRLVRAGKGAAGVWNIEAQPTHGPNGTKIIGKKMKKAELEDTWRDINDLDEIERSTGSATNATITFEDKEFKPFMWHAHPDSSKPAVKLTATEPGILTVGAAQYYCRALDLENGGRVVARYLGHGGSVTSFSTSPSDQSVFLTSASDGFARLYDVRTPLPVLTLDSGNLSESCPDSVLIHPDGHPLAFTGSERSEQITLWDLRSRASIYELTTGNNAIVSMAWDSANNVLYAATNCSYMDRLGNHHDYRPSKIPRGLDGSDESNKDAMETDDGENNEEEWDDEDDEDDEGDDTHCWPKNAYHHEDYFGYNFDAGEHRLYQYAFKSEPDTKIVPDYGNGSIAEFGYW